MNLSTFSTTGVVVDDVLYFDGAIVTRRHA